MSAELFAIMTALLRGFAAIPTKMGLKNSNPETSTLIYLILNTVLLWSMTFLHYSVEQISIDGLEYFALAGIFAPGIARVFRDVGIEKLGVTISIPIVGTNTLFSVLLSTIFIGEEITLYIISGALVIVLGLNMLTWRRGEHIEWRKRDLIYPIIAAILFASSTNLRKIGLEKTGYPVVGAALTSTISLMVLLLSLLVTKSRESALDFNKDSMKFFVFSSILSSLAFLFYFNSLYMSYIVKIQPIAATNQLFALLFSHIFLKNVEKITLNVVVGSVLVFIGIFLILI
jgi:uncharacterized membrane protein